MLVAKEKLNDMKWRDEVLFMLLEAIKQGNQVRAKELGEESKRVLDHINTHDYAPRQRRRELHIKHVQRCDHSSEYCTYA